MKLQTASLKGNVKADINNDHPIISTIQKNVPSQLAIVIETALWKTLRHFKQDKSSIQEVAAILKCFPDLINKKNEGGCTPLIFSALQGNPSLFYFLLSQERIEVGIKFSPPMGRDSKYSGCTALQILADKEENIDNILRQASMKNADSHGLDLAIFINNTRRQRNMMTLSGAIVIGLVTCLLAFAFMREGLPRNNFYIDFFIPAMLSGINGLTVANASAFLYELLEQYYCPTKNLNLLRLGDRLSSNKDSRFFKSPEETGVNQDTISEQSKQSLSTMS